MKNYLALSLLLAAPHITRGMEAAPAPAASAVVLSNADTAGSARRTLLTKEELVQRAQAEAQKVTTDALKDYREEMDDLGRQLAATIQQKSLEERGLAVLLIAHKAAQKKLDDAYRAALQKITGEQTQEADARQEAIKNLAARLQELERNLVSVKNQYEEASGGVATAIDGFGMIEHAEVTVLPDEATDVKKKVVMPGQVVQLPAESPGQRRSSSGARPEAPRTTAGDPFDGYGIASVPAEVREFAAVLVGAGAGAVRSGVAVWNWLNQ